MDTERILYPCYFNAALRRREGRRVPGDLAVEKPDIAALKAALTRLGLSFRVEEAHHPSRWMLREGRVLVAWDGKKEELIHSVARALGSRT
ncbi:MAG: signal recognition particle subunit SRP19/SEC65 family protein [Methanomicrobiaceae archaeon]|nr:signal recognition particle subunit SRP19/SEC65 family protein [Methanomicrobiaceae archaeon]